METYTNERGTKVVRITTDGQGAVLAMLVQYIEYLCGSERCIDEQVLQTKTFANIKNAECWANKMLG